MFFRSTMVAFKAIRSWLRLKLSEKAPKSWAERRRGIDDRITKFIRSSKSEASIEEIPDNKEEDIRNEDNIPVVNNIQRMEIESREGDIEKVLKYNILERKKDVNIQNWKSYPGVSKIIDMARDVVENGNIDNIDELARMMQCHESQQSVEVIATIAVIIGNKIQ